MRVQLQWPRTLRDWLPGLLASVPLAILLLSTRGGEPSSAALLASVAIVLSVPWVIPATMLLSVLSAPVYMWLHTQGPVPAVLDWLGSVVLVAAVVASHERRAADSLAAHAEIDRGDWSPRLSISSRATSVDDGPSTGS